jgi:hypothetical protein
MNTFMLIGLVSLVFGVVFADILVGIPRVKVKRIGKSRTHWNDRVPMLDTTCIDDDCDCHSGWCYDWKYDTDLQEKTN